MNGNGMKTVFFLLPDINEDRQCACNYNVFVDHIADYIGNNGRNWSEYAET